MTHNFGTSRNLCPGDSGGPGVFGTTGAVYSINSAYFVGSGIDIFGEAWQMRERLLDQIRVWNGTTGVDPVEPGEAEVRVVNETGNSLWVRCDGNTSASCTDWTFLADGRSALIQSPQRRLIFDNRQFNPSVEFRWFRTQAPGASVSIFSNPENPFLDPDAPAPEPEQRCAGGEDAGSAVALEDGIQGNVCANRDSWFSLDMRQTEEAEIKVLFPHADGDIDIALFDAQNAEQARSESTNNEESVSWKANSDEVVFLRVYGYNGASNRITVDLQRTAPEIEDPQDACVGGDQRRTADALQSEAQGSVCADQDSWFAIEVPANQEIEVQVAFPHADGDIDIALHDSNDNTIASSAGVSNQEVVRWKASQDSEVYLRVHGYRGASNHINVTVQRTNR